jgi:hypothetical protein
MKLKVIVVSLALSFSCLAADVKTAAAKDVDYSRYKTYVFLPSKLLTKSGVVDGDDRISPMIAKSVKGQLAKKGFTEVSANGDFEVVTWALSESVPQLEAVLFAPYGPVDWGTAPISTVGRYNREGTLAVNLIDSKTNKSIWAGMVTRALGKPSNVDRDIDKGASDLFKKFPTK